MQMPKKLSLKMQECDLSANSLFNPCQSAYTKHHSTETTLLSIHNLIINAISLQQVTCFTLLDLSAAYFDTKDHTIH
jgi:hypothetical protein